MMIMFNNMVIIHVWYYFFTISENTEYCNDEAFKAECPEGEVVVMTHALYGRMKIGKCVKVDLGGYKICINALSIYFTQ